jgi:hypothetical protein
MFYDLYQQEKSDEDHVVSLSFSTNKRRRKQQSLSFLRFCRQTSERGMSEKENILAKNKS